MRNLIINSSWQEQSQVIRKIYSFLKLPKGWHYGSGGPPSISIVKKALKIAEMALLSVFDADACPGVEGEIMVSIYHKEHYLEFIIEPDQSVTFTHEINDEEVFYQDNISFNSAIDEIEKFKKFSREIWKDISESSVNLSICQEIRDSEALHSATLQMVESQSYPKNASNNLENQFVNISGVFI
jgi:hypothetical protein